MVLALHLGTGTTVDVFQAVGTVPVAIDRLNNLVSTGVILEAVIYFVDWPPVCLHIQYTVVSWLN